MTNELQLSPRIFWSRNLLCLVSCQMAYTAAGSVCLVVSGLAGFYLADHKILATLPFALIHVATALVTFPLSLLMHRLGRKTCFIFGSLAGVAAAILCMTAIVVQSFPLLCAGSALFGVFQATSEYYRFAAAESVAERAIRQAVAWTIGLSLVGVLVGPQLGAVLDAVLAPPMFLGSYAAVAAFSIASAILAFGIEDRRSRVPVAHVGRSLGAALRRPAVGLALVASAVAFGVMVTAMTALPVAAVGCGLSVGATGGIIQLHLIGMFIPSMFASRLVTKFSARQLLSAGGVIMIAGLGSLFGAKAFIPFAMGLFLVGAGWNFVYVSATEILASIPDSEERATAQGFNELLEFAIIGACALGAGAFYVLFGWNTLIITLATTSLCLLGVILASTVKLRFAP
ncbi:MULTISPECIES: MFS transporter [unclassified Mesorhizobium]|uniref:MFS transporter n=1 Tax=unclassified Mesorhizobium TaxID=325217 RepID=UPI00333AE0A4